MLYYLTELVEEEGFRLCKSFQSSKRIESLGLAVGTVVYERIFPCAVSDDVLKRAYQRIIDFYEKNYNREGNEFKDLTRFAI